MKRHAQIAEALAVYYDLDDADRQEVDQHVQDCATCAARLSAYRIMDWDLARLTDPRPEGRLREEFYTAIGIRNHQVRWSTRARHRSMRIPALASRAVELAVLALLIAGLGFTLRGWLQSPVPIGVPMSLTPGPSSNLSSTEVALPTEASPAATTDKEHTADSETAMSGRAMDWAMPNSPTVDSLAARAEYIPPISSQASFVAQGEEEGQVYIVQVDDNLWKLAEKYLGDGQHFGQIIQATHAKRAGDPSFALIEDPGRISPGFKLWIPTTEVVPSPSAGAPEKPPLANKPLPTLRGPGGHIAFSFWNNNATRCTYEINIIDVASCLISPEACQASRRIFSLNNVSEPALSPGGDHLAFRGWGEPPSEDSPYLHCAPAFEARYLANTTLDGTEFRGTGGFWEDSHPDWSPDGQQILFASRRHEDRISRIFVINADGSNERDLRIAGQHPSWAPDGQRFVYRGCDLTGNRCGLWLAYAAPVKSWETGANLIRPVVQDDRVAHPDWSPASDQIVFQSSASGSWDLYVVDADTLPPGGTDGNSPQQLTNDPGIEGLPAWSPDGQWIAYLSDAGGNWGIWIMLADGSQRHLLFPFDGGIFTPRAVEPYGQRDWIDEQISWSK